MPTVTWDSVNKGTGAILSNGNLTAVIPNSSNTVRASLGRTSGKWYWEITLNNLTGLGGAMVGIVNGLVSLTVNNISSQNIRYIYSNTGNKYPSAAGYAVPFGANDVIGVALDLDNGTIEFYINGLSYGFSHTDIKILGEVFPAVSSGASTGNTNTVNFGASPFAYYVPDGYMSYDNTQSSVNKILLSSGGVIYSPSVNPIEHVTNMTNNTTPAPLVASASSSPLNSSLQPYVPFSVVAITSRWEATSSKDEWISLDFGTNKPVNKVKIKAGGSTEAISRNSAPKDFTIEGSNDKQTWHILKTVQEEIWKTREEKDFFLDTTGNFRHYRINMVSSVDGTSTIKINKIAFINNEVIYNPITSTTESDFLNYGMNLSTFHRDFPFHKIYNFLGDLDILYYTGAVEATSHKIEKTLNYSPFDALDGRTEFVAYMGKPNESRKFEYKGTPASQFNYLINATLSDDINSITPTEISNPQDSSIKYIISPDDITWYSYKNGNWIVVDTSNKMNILTNSMSRNELVTLQRNQLQQIIIDRFSIGILLTESFRTVEEIGVDKIDFGVSIRANNAEVNKADFSILNTTAEINVTFAGNTLSGNVVDVDKGKVQYSVSLNGTPYYPSDGSFSILQPSPVNLRITLDPKLVLIGQHNTIQVFFRDAWGNTDVWDTTFIGTMTGLLFVDASGNYYSTETGQILQQLDFGTIIAGQTTLEHEIKLINTYGYTVNNIKISANQQNFPTGLNAQFGTNLITFEALDELVLNRTLDDGDDLTFYVRLASQWGTFPTSGKAFDIEVTADKV